MGPLGWLLDAQVHVAGSPVLVREIVGNGFGLASALLGLRRVVWAW
ncbi:nicotinamide riboside transporter PnuC, partial [Micromonospora sp. D75]|nr:nicotinamide riboside transporter PnuC [Micromonospora sp. D75]